jgi:hypothetical protein
MAKMLKNLASLLRETAIVSSMAIPLFFTGCKKPDEPIIETPKDTTPPEITISSPEKDKEYNSKKVFFSGSIKEPNFDKAEYSTDNGQTKKSLEQTWSDTLYLSEGNQKVIVYASDKFNNSSTSTINFSVKEVTPPKDTIPPKITISSPEKKTYNTNIVHFQGNITDENFSEASYSLNNGENINLSQSWSEDKQLENGDYRYIVKSKDKAGNSSADTLDFVVDFHTWKYLVNPFVQPNDTTKPIVWNNFSTTDQRSSYFYDRLYNYDKTDTITYIPDQFVCTDFASVLAINFNGYPGLPPDPRGLYNNNWHNIPMYIIYLSVTGGNSLHTIDGVVVRDDMTDINSWIFTESESDSTYSPSKLKELGAYEIQVNYTRVLDTETQGKVLDNLPMFKFILDGTGKWVDSGYRNPDINLIEERKK